MKIVAMSNDNVAEVAVVEELSLPNPWSEQMLAAELPKDNTYYIVAQIDGKVVGYMGIYTAADEGYITNIAVHPNFRQRGIATALINDVCNYAVRQQLAFVTLEVRESNIHAAALYTKLGFGAVGLRKNFYTNPVEPAILMTKYFTTQKETV